MGATDTMPTGDKIQCRASLIEWKTDAQPTHANMMKTHENSKNSFNFVNQIGIVRNHSGECCIKR